MPVLQHPHGFQAFFHAFPDILRGHAEIFRPKSHIFFHHGSDDLVIRILKDHACRLPHRQKFSGISGIFPIHPDRPFGRHQDRIQMFGKCRFPGSVVAENRHELSGRYVHIHAVYGPGYADHIAFFVSFFIFIYQMFCLYNIHGSSLQSFLPPFLSAVPAS